MPRMARLVVPGYPHHITQRGNRRQRVFFTDDDYHKYIDLLARAMKKAGVILWAYCLMPNHVHLVAVPEREDSLAALFGDAHRRYTRMINRREGWKGHLWQERFFSSPMDEKHLLATVRYTELNPLRAGLCRKPTDWRWSSVHAHMRACDDALVTVAPMLELIQDWPRYLAMEESATMLDDIRQHQRTGRPLGDKAFIDELERVTGRRLHKARPGRKKSRK